jgi:TRAP-type mannitol/chloroaromatic compound transport system permease small subunit
MRIAGEPKNAAPEATVGKGGAMYQRIAARVERLAQFVAVLGGAMLLVMTVLTVISIAGRQLIMFGLGPVPGDFELVAAGTAFAVSAFMPWTQLQRGHADVAILAEHFSRRINAVIDLVTELLLFGMAVLITWRLLLGLLDKMAYGETTFILQFPLWWGYAGCLIGLVTWIIVGAFSVWSALRALASNTPMHTGPGAGH